MSERDFDEGARVYTYDSFGFEQKGTIHQNSEYPDVSDYYITYDDGEECAVLDLSKVHIID